MAHAPLHHKPSSFPTKSLPATKKTGKFLIPGLIDSHVHISNVEGLENATPYGVSTAMNMACNNYTTCSRLKQQPGLSDFLTAGLPAAGPNSTRAKSQRLPAYKLAVGNGSNWYKITLEVKGPSYDLTRRLNSAVHGLGQQTMSHASDLRSYQQAIEMRIDGIQHKPDDGNLTHSMIQTLKANMHWQYVTLTLTIHAFSLHPIDPAVLTFLRGMPNPKKILMVQCPVLFNGRSMYHAGVPLLADTDTVGPIASNITLSFGDTLHREFQYHMQDVGISPAEAINAATRVVAKYHRLHDRGVVQDIMRAALVSLTSDPAVDIRNTRDIEAVWVGGRRFFGSIPG